MGGSKPPAVPQVVAPPKQPETTQASREAQLAERRRADQRKGRRATILTGPQGLQEQAAVQRKTLLGA